MARHSRAAFGSSCWIVVPIWCAAILLPVVSAEEPGPTPGKQVPQEMTVQVRLGYLLFLPEGYSQTDKPWPMILFLHGAGESGNDLDQVKQHGPPKLAETNTDLVKDFIVLSPQSPGFGWNPDMLIDLLDYVVPQYHVDVDRIYLTGLSMGGYGTWNLAAAQPDRFAAIVPICGGGNTEHAERLKDLPTWVFHGEKDNVVPIERSRAMVDALEAVGGNVKFTVYPNADHDAWTKTYEDPELYHWLLQHRRPAGKWAGTWQGESGHGGDLRCVAWREDEVNWRARFSGHCGELFAFEVEMKGRQEDDAVRFEGEADLGEKNGGVYQWTGQIVDERFTGQYSSSLGEKGEFQMTRETANR